MQLTLSFHHGSPLSLTAAFLLLLRQHDKLTEDLILIGSAEGTFVCLCASERASMHTRLGGQFIDVNF